MVAYSMSHSRFKQFALFCVAATIAIGLNQSCAEHIPVDPPANIEDGKRNFQVGKFRKAIQDFDKAIAADPKQAEAHFFKALSYYALCDSARMFDELDAVEEVGPGTAYGLMARACNIQFGTGKSPKAVPLANQALEKDSKSGWPYLIRSLVNRKSAERFSDTREALKRCPDQAIVYDHLGELFLGPPCDCAKAEENFRIALKLDPSSQRALGQLGLTKLRSNEPAEAESLLKKSLAEDPLYLPARMNLSLLYEQQKNRAAAEELWQKPSKQLIENPLFYMLRGTYYHRVHKTDAGISDLTKFIELSRTRRSMHDAITSAYVERSGLYLDHSDFEKAYDDAGAAKTLYPDSVDVLMHYAQCAIRAGRYDQFDEVMKGIFARTDLTPVMRAFAHVYYAQGLRAEGKFEESTKHLQAAEKLAAQVGDLNLQIARGYAESKDFKSALKHFQRASDLGVKTIEVDVAISDCLLVLKRKKEALDQLAKMLSRHGSDPHAWMVSARISGDTNPEKAIADVDHAISLGLLSEDDWEAAGNLYLTHKKPEQAARCFAELLVLRAQRPDVRRGGGHVCPIVYAQSDAV